MNPQPIPPVASYPAPAVSTLKNRAPAADICRANGWGPGTHLVGDEGYGPRIIRITAVGETCILAIAADRSDDWEATWTLECRDWRAVPQ